MLILCVSVASRGIVLILCVSVASSVHRAHVECECGLEYGPVLILHVSVASSASRAPFKCESGASRVGQNRIYTLYMTVYLMKLLQKVPCCIHSKYMWFWSTLSMCNAGAGPFYVPIPTS